MGQPEELDPRIVKALSHPLRVQILDILSERVASPNQMAKMLNETVQAVSYHTNVLARAECIEEVRQEPKRGAVEHFFRARPIAGLGSSHWQQIPESLKGNLVATSLQGFVSQVVDALEAETFPGRTGSTFTWETLTVDQRGWDEVISILGEVRKQMEVVSAASRRRLGEKDGFSVVAAFALFETASKGGACQ